MSEKVEKNGSKRESVQLSKSCTFLILVTTRELTIVVKSSSES